MHWQTAKEAPKGETLLIAILGKYQIGYFDDGVWFFHSDMKPVDDGRAMTFCVIEEP